MTAISRRRFFAASTAAVAASALPITSQAQVPPALRTGNGAWTYGVVPGWGKLPPGKVFGGTHGAVTTDRAGQVYVSTQSDTGILVYTPEGVFVKSIAADYPEIHSLVHAEEGGEEFFYATVQKGTPKENWLFLKMKADGTVVQKITAPNQWRITAAIPGPDGSIGAILKPKSVDDPL